MFNNRTPDELRIDPPWNVVDSDEQSDIPMFTALFRYGCNLPEALKQVYARNPGSSPLTFIDAACSSGAIGYSLLSLHNHMSPDREVHFTGYDINPNAINAARTGIFNMLESNPDTIAKVRGDISKYGLQVAEAEKGRPPQINVWPVTDGHQVNFEQVDVSKGITRDGNAHLITANNVLYHLKREKADRFLDNLIGVLDRNGVLNISGDSVSPIKRMGVRVDKSDIKYLRWLDIKTDELSRRYGLKPIMRDSKKTPLMFAY